VLPISIRPLAQGEQPFVLDGWIRSWRTSPWAGCIANNLVWAATRDTIAGLALRGANIDVAVSRGTDTERLVGFVCYEKPDVVHYLFVKRRGFRGLGIGRQLLAHAQSALGLAEPGRFTHRTTASKMLLDLGWTWDPIPARVAEIKGQEDIIDG
jgi:GNAT superfamily N-acetyltransferase